MNTSRLVLNVLYQYWHNCPVLPTVLFQGINTGTGKYEFLQQIIISSGKCCPTRISFSGHLMKHVSHTYPPRHETQQSVCQFSNTSFPFTPCNITCSGVWAETHFLPSSSTPMQEAITPHSAPHAWLCLAGRSVLPSQFCQLD